jgi:pimeloyl-ACP methyl ester carboxylesterase
MSFRIKSVKLPQRVTLQYVEQGNASGIPVILLHGYTDSWRSYERVLPYLPQSIRAFALTQRGHGDSERPPEGYRPQDFAADVAAFMDALGLRTAVIVGHSMGSHIAQRFALDYPERTLGLVLLGAFYSIQANPDVAGLMEAIASLHDPVDPGFVRDFQVSTLGQPIPPTYLDAIVNESLKLPARVWQAVLTGLLEYDYSTELGRIKAPTLIVWGSEDAFCSRSDQEALESALSGSRLTVYVGAGHALHWEEPQRFAADLAAFSHVLAWGLHRPTIEMHDLALHRYA